MLDRNNIIKIKAFRISTRLSKSISIKDYTFDRGENIILQLQHGDIYGYGEAVPFQPHTGDSLEDIITQIKRLSLRFNPLYFEPSNLHAYLDSKISSHTLHAAIDIAYHDLVGKIHKKPIHALYTNKYRPILTSITLSLKKSISLTARELHSIYKKYQNIKVIKVKLMGDESDLARANIIRKLSPKGIKFILDANQGFIDPKVAVRILSGVCTVLKEVLLIEEPCPKRDLDKMKYVTRSFKNIPIFADESISTYADVKKIIHTKAASGINIKLQKIGGIWPAYQIAKLCQTNNIKVMVGCMLESSIGISAAIHFAGSLEGIVVTDLDSDLLLPRYTDCIPQLKYGKRILKNGYGLGVSINWRRLEYYKRVKKIQYDKIFDSSKSPVLMHILNFGRNIKELLNAACYF